MSTKKRKDAIELNLNLEHDFWECNVQHRGLEWLDKVITFLNRWYANE